MAKATSTDLRERLTSAVEGDQMGRSVSPDRCLDQDGAPIWACEARRAVPGAGAPRSKTSTFVGAPRLDGMTAPMVLDGAMHGAAFLAYVEQVLAPPLAKIKAFLAKTAARTVDDLWNAIAQGIGTFTPAECPNCFAAAGYDCERSEDALDPRSGASSSAASRQSPDESEKGPATCRQAPETIGGPTRQIRALAPDVEIPVKYQK